MECYGFFTVLKNLCLINFWRHHVSTIFWKTKMSYLFRLCTWISRHRLSVIRSLWFFYACKNSEVTASVVKFCSDRFHWGHVVNLPMLHLYPNWPHSAHIKNSEILYIFFHLSLFSKILFNCYNIIL